MIKFNIKRSCRFVNLALLTIIATLASVNSHAETQMLDRVIAIVDDDVVLYSEMENRYNQVKQNIAKSGKQAPPEEQIRKQILDQLILESIQLQMAYRAGVRINDAQLNQSLSRIAQQNGMDLAQFRAALEADGQSYNATREQIRREMMLQRIQQGNVNQRVQISDQEIKNFLDSEEGRGHTAPEYRVLHALIPSSAEPQTAEDLRASVYANELYKKLKKGADFKQTVADTSVYAINSGDLGWRKLDDLPSLLAGPVPKLSAGQAAEPIRSASGYHLIMLVDKRGEGEVVAQTRARHILLKASAIRDEAATETAIKKLRQRALDGEDFAELAREYSEDIGSAAEGGDLSWTSPGQLVPAFQKAMDSTDIGGTSAAFRSQYGWHVLQVTERRDKDVTEDLRRNIARNFIHKRKFDDELQVWLQKIRDEAYVDLK